MYYHTYRRGKESTRYGETVSSYIAKMVKVKSQMKAHFFDPKGLIPITEFVAAFKISCDSNRIHEDAAMWVLSHDVNATPVNALNSRRWAQIKAFQVAISVHKLENQSPKLLRWYPDVANYSLKKFWNRPSHRRI